MSRIHPQSLVPTERLELIEDPAPVGQATIENIAIALAPMERFFQPILSRVERYGPILARSFQDIFSEDSVTRAGSEIMGNPRNLFTTRSLHISSVAAATCGAGLLIAGVFLSALDLAYAEEVLMAGWSATAYGIPVSLALVANNYRQAIRNIAPYNAVVNPPGNQYAQENEIGTSRFGFHPTILPQLLHGRETSFLVDSSESIINSLKTSTGRISSEDVASLLNHLFTDNHKPLNENLVENLTAASVAEAQDQIDYLFTHRLDYRLALNDRGGRMPSPITDRALIQVFAYAHLVGTLKTARATGSDLDLPDVDLRDLTQKYQNFYDGFSAYCERRHGAEGREFAQEYLLPKLSNFVATGQEFNFDDDVEAAINPAPTQVATEIPLFEQKTDDTPNRSVTTQMESVFRMANRDQFNISDEDSSRSSSGKS